MRKHLLILVVIAMTLISCGGEEVISDGLAEYHHIFPKEFRNDFLKIGIDVDDFTTVLTKRDHRGIGKGLQYKPKNWNQTWKDFLNTNTGITQKKVERQAKEMMIAAGCKGEFKFYNYTTKELSGATIAGSSKMLVISNNTFLNFSGRLGYILIDKMGGSKLGGQILALLATIGSSVLGLFGIKAGQPVTIGVGLIVIIIAIIVFIGLIIFISWIIPVILSALGITGFLSFT